MRPSSIRNTHASFLVALEPQTCQSHSRPPCGERLHPRHHALSSPWRCQTCRNVVVVSAVTSAITELPQGPEDMLPSCALEDLSDEPATTVQSLSQVASKGAYVAHTQCDPRQFATQRQRCDPPPVCCTHPPFPVEPPNHEAIHEFEVNPYTPEKVGYVVPCKITLHALIALTVSTVTPCIRGIRCAIQHHPTRSHCPHCIRRDAMHSWDTLCHATSPHMLSSPSLYPP